MARRLGWTVVAGLAVALCLLGDGCGEAPQSAGEDSGASATDARAVADVGRSDAGTVPDATAGADAESADAESLTDAAVEADAGPAADAGEVTADAGESAADTGFLLPPPDAGCPHGATYLDPATGQQEAVGGPCKGLGMCGTGTVVCNATGAGATCSTNPDAVAGAFTRTPDPANPGSFYPRPDIDCDGEDDDCNGIIDDAAGLALWCGCNPLLGRPPSSTDTTCDGIDDDCNGLIDDGVLGGASACSCTLANPADLPAIKATQETCNSKDDNCDGQVDEGGDALCDDGNQCTADTCTATGCNHTAITGACDDGNPCSLGDFCEAGHCRSGGIVVNCDDGDDVCTVDSCDETGACVHTPTGAPGC
jgi:hypothetical protein